VYAVTLKLKLSLKIVDILLGKSFPFGGQLKGKGNKTAISIFRSFFHGQIF